MKNTFNAWNKVNQFNLEQVIDLVLTNGTSDTIQSDIGLISLMGDKNNFLSILDFGCGVGRNIFNFSLDCSNWKFYGYDNDNMIKKANQYSKVRFNKNINEYPNIKIVSDWDQLKTMRFDCIYATIVFQHIYEKDLNIYLQDIRHMTNRMIVSGRRFNDDMIDGKYKNTWQILENNGYYPSNASEIKYSIEGELDNHMTCIYDF